MGERALRSITPIEAGAGAQLHSIEERLARVEANLVRLMTVATRIEEALGRVQRYGKALAAVVRHIKWE